MRTILSSLLAAACLCSGAKADTIQKTCLGADTETDYRLLYDALEQKDHEVLARLILSGRAREFDQGETVALTGVTGFLWSLVKVRKRGDRDSYLLPAEWVTKQADAAPTVVHITTTTKPSLATESYFFKPTDSTPYKWNIKNGKWTDFVNGE
jgi:hypothetical protein